MTLPVMRRMLVALHSALLLAVAASGNSFSWTQPLLVDNNTNRHRHARSSRCFWATAASSDPSGSNRRARKKLHPKQQQDYKRRRTEWLEKYGSLEALESTFGRARGDLTVEQTRRLYHTLLPRSLLGLYEMGLMKPEELAPLAYEARVAAKEYARRRCVWTGRLMTALFDRYRNLRDRGRWSKTSSLTWEELWQKYEAQIVQEECADVLNNNGELSARQKDALTMRIYHKILERSCATNQAFDSLFLKEDDSEHSDDLAKIASQLEHDVREILLRPKEHQKVLRRQEKAMEKQRKAVLKERQEQEKLEKKENKKRRKAKRKEKKKQKRDHAERESGELVSTTSTKAADNKMSPQRWEVLRILAGTRRKFLQLRGDTRH